MERDLADDLANDPEIMEKIKHDGYAQNVYASLCNMRWHPKDVWAVLKDEFWSCSWRAAGGVVSALRGHGSYMDWYCSGMSGLVAVADDDAEEVKAVFDNRGYVREGVVTDEIRKDFDRIGWYPSEWPDE